MKSNFYILFKTFKDKMIMKQQQLAKRAKNFQAERKEESEFEQKPLLKLNEFTDEEEREIKEQQREKNRKRKQQVSDEERLAKLQKKTAHNKEKEKQMWEKLGELNKKFKDIKKHERAEDKKMSATIVHQEPLDPACRLVQQVNLFYLVKQLQPRQSREIERFASVWESSKCIFFICCSSGLVWIVSVPEPAMFAIRWIRTTSGFNW